MARRGLASLYSRAESAGDGWIRARVCRGEDAADCVSLFACYDLILLVGNDHRLLDLARVTRLIRLLIFAVLSCHSSLGTKFNALDGTSTRP